MGLEWMSRAACLGADGEDFFPVGRGGPADEQVAYVTRMFCYPCGVRGECLSFALENHINDGVFGGLTGDERQSLKRREARARTRDGGAPVRSDLMPVERGASVIKRTGLTNKEISRRTGIHKDTVSKIRRGISQWVEPGTLAKLEAVAAAVAR